MHIPKSVSLSLKLVQQQISRAALQVLLPGWCDRPVPSAQRQAPPSCQPPRQGWATPNPTNKNWIIKPLCLLTHGVANFLVSRRVVRHVEASRNKPERQVQPRCQDVGVRDLQGSVDSACRRTAYECRTQARPRVRHANQTTRTLS